MQRGTPKRNIRIPDDLWNEAMAVARGNDTNVSQVINEFLRDYIETQANPYCKDGACGGCFGCAG